MNGIQLPCPPPVVNSYLGDVVETLSIVAAASCRGNGIEKETIRQQQHQRETQIRNGGSFSFSAFLSPGQIRFPTRLHANRSLNAFVGAPKKKNKRKKTASLPLGKIHSISAAPSDIEALV